MHLEDTALAQLALAVLAFVLFRAVLLMHPVAGIF